MKEKGTKLSDAQEEAIVETWGRLVKGKAMRESLRRKKNLEEAGEGMTEPEPEPELDLAEILLEREAAISADQADGDRQFETAATTTPQRSTSASQAAGASVNEDDLVTVTALTRADPIPPVPGVLSGTPSPARDEVAAAAVRSLVVGASMVALVAQRIRRTDKMRHGAKHVVGQVGFPLFSCDFQ